MATDEAQQRGEVQMAAAEAQQRKRAAPVYVLLCANPCRKYP